MLRSYVVWGENGQGKMVDLTITAYDESTAWKAIADYDVTTGKMWETTYGADELLAQW